MSHATPDVASDLIAKITALDAADFPAGTVRVDGEDAPGGNVAEGGVTWVKFKLEVREDYDFDGAIRYHTFQVKRRADLAVDAKAQATKAAMVKLADLLNKLGAWTGTSGAVYMDALITMWPAVREEQYVLMDVQVSFDTPSTI